MGIPNKLTYRQTQEIARRYKEGEYAGALAQEFGVTIATVRYHVLKINGAMRNGTEHNENMWKKRGGKITESEKIIIRRLYLAGKGCDTIAKMIGRSVWGVYRQVRKMGINRNNQAAALLSPNRCDKHSQDVVRMFFDEKMPKAQIARQLGINHRTVDRLLDSYLHPKEAHAL